MTASAKTLTSARALVRTIAEAGAKIDQYIVDLGALKGMTYADWESVRSDFITAYCEARGVGPKDKTASAAARKGWSRIMAALGVKKPVSDSTAAVAKRGQRAKKPVATGKVVSPMAATEAAKKAATVKESLTAIEAHLLSLFRRGQFAAMIDILRSEVEKAATV